MIFWTCCAFVLIPVTFCAGENRINVDDADVTRYRKRHAQMTDNRIDKRFSCRTVDLQAGADSRIRTRISVAEDPTEKIECPNHAHKISNAVNLPAALFQRMKMPTEFFLI